MVSSGAWRVRGHWLWADLDYRNMTSALHDTHPHAFIQAEAQEKWQPDRCVLIASPSGSSLAISQVRFRGLPLSLTPRSWNSGSLLSRLHSEFNLRRGSRQSFDLIMHRPLG